MADFYDALTEKQIEFISKQHMFFIATAHATGRINLSPKGLDAFRVLSPNKVAYLDMMGSGNETCAHLQNDGRATIMFCSFDQSPNILRLYGRGEVMGPTDPQWAELIPQFTQYDAQRQMIIIHVESTQDSCGWAVPRYEFIEERDTLNEYVRNKYSRDQLNQRLATQTQSIDGLPITPTAQV